MINTYSDVNTISLKDVLDTLALFMDNGGYSDEELLCFVSYLTGLSTDKILETIEDNHLPDDLDAEKKDPVPPPQGLTRERVMDMFRAYVNNDAEAAEVDYVRDALGQAGCDRETAEALGLGWVFSSEDEE